MASSAAPRATSGPPRGRGAARVAAALTLLGRCLLVLAVALFTFNQMGVWAEGALKLRAPGARASVAAAAPPAPTRAAVRPTPGPPAAAAGALGASTPTTAAPAVSTLPASAAAAPLPATAASPTPGGALFPVPASRLREPVVPPPALAPSYGPALRIQIPSIGVNQEVSEVGVVDGAYEVPLWNIGHHQDSVNPGEPGNAVFNGHLTTIAAGRVFARLKDVKVGDAVTVLTAGYRLDWRVRETTIFTNTDNSFIQPTTDTRITLYTCAGTFLLPQRDYSHRLAVVATLLSATPLG